MSDEVKSLIMFVVNFSPVPLEEAIKSHLPGPFAVGGLLLLIQTC